MYEHSSDLNNISSMCLTMYFIKITPNLQYKLTKITPKKSNCSIKHSNFSALKKR